MTLMTSYFPYKNTPYTFRVYSRKVITVVIYFIYQLLINPPSKAFPIKSDRSNFQIPSRIQSQIGNHIGQSMVAMYH